VRTVWGVPSDLIALRRGELELELCPRFGGAITRLRCAGRDVLRPATPRFFATGEAVESASFPLVPFSNRIENGELCFRGRRYRLPANLPGEPHAIHGQGWQRPWQVVQTHPESAALVLEHSLPETPFTYRARQTFSLHAWGLELGLELLNLGSQAMPAGLGFHPYFERAGGVTLQTDLDCVWLPDEGKIPRGAASLPPVWDFSSVRGLDGLELDHCFGGWGGRARLTWPSGDLRVDIVAEPPLAHLVLYLPQRETYFCVEPVSHAPDAFNLWERGVNGTGTRVLGPGEQLTARAALHVALPER